MHTWKDLYSYNVELTLFKLILTSLLAPERLRDALTVGMPLILPSEGHQDGTGIQS